MKNHDTPQKPTVALCPYVSIPLEVAQDHVLSDGAILLFGEIYGLQKIHGRCFATDAHFQSRRGKGRSTIQRQITELSKSGHLYVINDGKSHRELRVAERYLGSKDRQEYPRNENGDRPCPKSEAENPVPHLINEKQEAFPCPKNETRKTLESQNKNREKRTTPSHSSGVVLSSQLSPEQEKAVKAAVRVLDDVRNETAYASLYIQASERGRLDAWEIALASTQKARLKSGHMKQDPIAYFRIVLMKSWQLDCAYLQHKSKQQEQSQAKAVASQGSTEAPPHQPEKSSSAPAMTSDRNDVGEGDFNGENDNFEGDVDPSAPVGNESSLSAFLIPAISDVAVPKGAVNAYDAFIASIPVDQRDELVSRAKAIVQEKHTTIWARGEDKLGCLLLITEACKKLMNQKGL